MIVEDQLPVREERLRSLARLSAATIALSAWRGRSGRRYVVGVHPLDGLTVEDVEDLGDVVVIAVRRTEHGTARPAEVIAFGPGRCERRCRRLWLARHRLSQTTEMHVHRLAESEAERAAIVADLQDAQP